MTTKKKLLVLIVSQDDLILHALTRDLKILFHDELWLKCFSNASSALDFLHETFSPSVSDAEILEDAPVLLPIVFSGFDLPDQNGLDFLRNLRSKPGVVSQARHVLLGNQAGLEELRIAFNEGLIQKALAIPWTHDEIYSSCKDLLSQYILSNAFEQIEFYTDLVSHQQYSAALLKSKRTQEGLRENLRSLQRGLLVKRSNSLGELIADLRAEFHHLEKSGLTQRVLRRIAAGEELFAEGSSLTAMWLILEGEVSHRKKQSGQEDLFVEGPGHILGSMSYFLNQGAFTQVIAIKDTELAVLDPETFDWILERRPDFAPILINILLRQGMSRVKQHVEQTHRLKVALDELHAAEDQLIESEKLATLGQLVAGVAHELNNPAAAIIRAADHVADSFKLILASSQKISLSEQERSLVFSTGFSGTPQSTQEIRERASRLASEFGFERDVARMIVEMELDKNESALKRFHGLKDVSSVVEILHNHHQAGKFLRSLQSSGRRVSEIVQSLRNYARPAPDKMEDFDVTQSVEDAVVILHNRLKLIRFEKIYRPASLIKASPGELGQVWTNLLTNALDAVADKEDPCIKLEVGDVGSFVTIAVQDNGCGMDPEQIDRIFEINYTTKKQGHFGLGLGLAICEKIITKYGGKIDVKSKRGEGSLFQVSLPASKHSR